MKYQHVMIDLETMSTKPDAAIVSVGAVAFDPADGEIGPSFYRVIDLAGCEKYGLHIDGDTVLWWLKQTAKARAAIVDGNMPLAVALRDLTVYANTHLMSTVRVWGNGVDFDNVILLNAYHTCKLTPFWTHWNNRCVRTMVELGRHAGIDPKTTLNFEGEPHCALDDAIHQARYVSVIHQHLIKPINDDI